VDGDAALKAGRTLAEEVQLRGSLRRRVRQLSGGNQQKVALAKWLLLRPRVLLCDEPTRGIDVGAKAEIYTLLRELAAEGTAILFASSELPEVLGLADRILVMHEGRLTAELSAAAADETSIIRAASGLSAGSGSVPMEPLPAGSPPG
jgi:rhamnose transport system ATP-binding protein